MTPNPTMKSPQTQALLRKGVAPEGSGFEGAALWPHPPQPSDWELEYTLTSTRSPGSLVSVSQTLTPLTSSASLNLFRGTSYAWSARASLDTQ